MPTAHSLPNIARSESQLDVAGSTAVARLPLEPPTRSGRSRSHGFFAGSQCPADPRHVLLGKANPGPLRGFMRHSSSRSSVCEPLVRIDQVLLTGGFPAVDRNLLQSQGLRE